MTPERETELAEALEAYTNPNSPEFDPVFNAEIRARQPRWFADQDDGAVEPPLLIVVVTDHGDGGA